ncbi:MAG: NADH-quinone oxidoreductase subunit J [Planctomycetes bacterium]|nr:NADH-quinone oxidoreductase subunit J [Planctomycetota bacterium]
MSTFLVLLVGALIVVAALMTVTQRNPIHAALSMLIALGGVGALMIGLKAHFLAAMQVLLYGGAIMVLFVFVIMLLTLREDELGPEPPSATRLLAAVGALALTFILFSALSRRSDTEFREPDNDAKIAAAEAKGDVRRRTKVYYGSTEHFARVLYTDYAVPFELITVLVMAAVAGVIVLARRPDSMTLEATKLMASPAASRAASAGGGAA